MPRLRPGTVVRSRVCSCFAMLMSGLATVAVQAQCGDPGAGDCCQPHSGIGCSDEACCTLVCNADPYCCDVGWDEYCAGNAGELCGGCEPITRAVMGFGGAAGLPGGLAIGGGDLAAYDDATGSWSLFLDGDAIGLGGTSISAVAALANGDLVLAIAGGGFVADLADGPAGGAVDAVDLVRFTPETVVRYTAGTLSFLFDGSDVGLSGGMSISAVAALDDGSLIMSFEGGGSLPGVGSFAKQDLVHFAPSSLGAATAGSWSVHLDGSDVGLSHNNEAIDAIGTTATGDLLISTRGNASVPGVSAGRGDLMGFTPSSLGSASSGVFYDWFDGTASGLSNGDNVAAFAMVTFSWPVGERPGDGGGGGGGGGVNPPSACGDQTAGDCCTVHDTPYCADGACCELVCSVDPLCCSTVWDENCVANAAALCEPCMPVPLLVGSFGGATTLPGDLVVDGCDLAAFNSATGSWNVFFDGDDVGLSGLTIAAASVLESGELLMAIEGGGVVGGLVGGPNGSTVDAYDLVRFSPDQLGEVTAGMWHFHFDGSDVGLSSSGDQAIAAVSAMADGSLLIATQNGGSLPGVPPFKGQDLMRFVPSSLGQATAGAWSMHFDGSDVGFSNNNEKLDAVFADADGSLLMSSKGNVSAGSFGAGRSDVFRFTPYATGSSTSGTLSTELAASQMGVPNGTNLRAVFRTVLVDPVNPRPSTSAKLMFDPLPDATFHDLAIEQGHLPYIIIYEGVDPNASSTGVIDAALVVEAIRSKHGDSPSGYGILDFENPFLDRLQAGPADPNYQLTVDTIVNLLQTVRSEFPMVQWSMYGMPRLRYWFNNSNWANATEEAKEAELSSTLANYTPVLREMDWINPSVYDRYELALFGESSWNSVTARETAFRRYQMELCNRFNTANGGEPKEIVPMVSPMFWKVGTIEYNMKQMTLEELLRDQVRPLVEMGATGVAFWTGLSYWTRAATSAETLGVLQAEARFAFTYDFLGGVEPAVWSDPQLKVELDLATSEHVYQRLGEVKAEIEALLSEPGEQGP